MKCSKKISVITPCYNGADHIECAILSVLSQSLDDVEMIVVDDGSTDLTPEICSRYSNQIRYYRTENKGAGHARNFALDVACGKWIIYLDSDDLILHNAINQEFWDEIESIDADVICTPWTYADMELSKHITVDDSEHAEEIIHIPRHEFWTCIYRREFLQQNGIKFYEIRQQDIATAFRYLVFSNSPRVVTRNDIRFHLQRDNLNSNTHTWNAQVMHAVKAQVYYDLLANHATERSQLWLYENVIEQIYSYYLEVSKIGYCSEDDFRTIGKLVHAIIPINWKMFKRVCGKRYYVKNIYLKMKLAFTAKQSEIRAISSDKRCCGKSTSEIMERLKAVSTFVKV